VLLSLPLLKRGIEGDFTADSISTISSAKPGLFPHGAVPSLCGANHRGSSWLVNFGTAPDGAGDSSEITAIRLEL